MLPSVNTAEKIEARYAILASLPLPGDIPDDSLTPVLIPAPYSLHDFVGTTSGVRTSSFSLLLWADALPLSLCELSTCISLYRSSDSCAYSQVGQLPCLPTIDHYLVPRAGRARVLPCARVQVQHESARERCSSVVHCGYIQ